MPNNSDGIWYSMFVANLQVVRATHACTLMGCLILVSCLSIWGWSSLHSIIKVHKRDIRRFSSHHVSGYFPLCTSSHQITLRGLHHIDGSGTVFSWSCEAEHPGLKRATQDRKCYLWQVFLPANTSSAKQNLPSFSVSPQPHVLPSSISFVLQVQPSTVKQQKNGKHSECVTVGHFVTQRSCATFSIYDAHCPQTSKTSVNGINTHSTWCAFWCASSVNTPLFSDESL